MDCWRLNMDDKLIMTDLMNTIKGICVLVNNAAIEADNNEINEVYTETLEECLFQQHEIYLKMKEMGWYPMENVKETEIEKVKAKF
jgi:spore coat protein CotF